MVGKVAIVTGGTRGIGLEITRALTGEGYKVAAIYAGNEEAAKLCEQETGAKPIKRMYQNLINAPPLKSRSKPSLARLMC